MFSENFAVHGAKQNKPFHLKKYYKVICFLPPLAACRQNKQLGTSFQAAENSSAGNGSSIYSRQLKMFRMAGKGCPIWLLLR